MIKEEMVTVRDGICFLDGERVTLPTDMAPIINKTFMESDVVDEGHLYVNCTFVSRKIPRGFYIFCFFIETAYGESALCELCGGWEPKPSKRRVPRNYLMTALATVQTVRNEDGCIDQETIGIHIYDRLEIEFLKEEIQKIRDGNM